MVACWLAWRYKFQAVLLLPLLSLALVSAKAPLCLDHLMSRVSCNNFLTSLRTVFSETFNVALEA